MIVGEATSKFQRGGHTLKKRSQLLNRGLGREVVVRRSVVLPVFVNQLFGAGERQFLVPREIMRLGSEFEDACAGRIRKRELALVALILLRFFRHFGGALI